MSAISEGLQIERARLLAEHRRRERDIDPTLYAHWQSGEMLMCGERKRLAAEMLNVANVFPIVGEQCLEVGYGTLGWLGDLISWGIPESDLHGIELDPALAECAQQTLPLADLQVGDATDLPWPNDYFRLVIVSTVFTSILNPRVRRRIAAEAVRVLAPCGALLWYDFAVNNPRNPHVRKVNRKELRNLFPQLQGAIRSITLAPPLARWLSRKSWVAATVASAIPFLRTHLIAVLVKPLRHLSDSTTSRENASGTAENNWT